LRGAGHGTRKDMQTSRSARAVKMLFTILISTLGYETYKYEPLLRYSHDVLTIPYPSLPKTLINPSSRITNALRIKHKSITRILRRKPKTLPGKVIIYKSIPPTNRIADITVSSSNLRLILYIICCTKIDTIIQACCGLIDWIILEQRVEV